MTDKRRSIPPLYLEKSVLGELDDFETTQLAGMTSFEERSQSDRRLTADNAAFHRVRSFRLPSRANRRPQPSFRLPALALLAAACIAGVVVLGDRMRSDYLEDGIILKGTGSALKVFRRDEAGYTSIPDGELARAGDLVQLRYKPAGATYGVIVSLDGRGEVTLHFPVTMSAPTKLERGGEITLDHAYELDDAPGFERFIFVTGEVPITPETVLEAARRVDASRRETAPLVLPTDWQQTDFVLRKPQ